MIFIELNFLDKPGATICLNHVIQIKQIDDFTISFILSTGEEISIAYDYEKFLSDTFSSQEEKEYVLITIDEVDSELNDDDWEHMIEDL